jgi:hypothetical protein
MGNSAEKCFEKAGVFIEMDKPSYLSGEVIRGTVSINL